jgi:hypothetical protein
MLFRYASSDMEQMFADINTLVQPGVTAPALDPTDVTKMQAVAPKCRCALCSPSTSRGPTGARITNDGQNAGCVLGTRVALTQPCADAAVQRGPQRPGTGHGGATPSTCGAESPRCGGCTECRVGARVSAAVCAMGPPGGQTMLLFYYNTGRKMVSAS